MSRRWLRLPALRTLQMLREDPLLLAATVLLSLSALAPLAATPILPLVDLGSSVGAACLLDDVAFGRGVASQHYAINPSLIPYWTVYALIAALELFFEPLLCAKIAVGIVVVMLPVAFMRVLDALGRSPRLGLWAFLLVWDNNLYWGWITFEYGMAFALLAFARLIEMRTARDALALLPLTALIALTHLNAIALLLVAGGLLALAQRPLGRSLGLHALALSGCVAPILPWIVSKLWRAGEASAPFKLQTHGLRQKLQSLFTYSLDVIPDGHLLTGIAFALLLIGAPALTLLPRRDASARQQWAALCLLIAGAGLYFALPFAIGGAVKHWHTYPRYATYILVALLALPSPQLRGWPALALAPGLACALVIHHAVFMQFKGYGEYVAPYLEIIRAIPRGSRLLPLDLDDYRYRGTPQAALGQLHGYAAATSSSYDPHLFDESNNPLLFRRDRMLPHPHWRRLKQFTLERHGQYYDYIIVHPLGRDPLRKRKASAAVELVREAGPWRLYRVRAPSAFPPR